MLQRLLFQKSVTIYPGAAPGTIWQVIFPSITRIGDLNSHKSNLRLSLLTEAMRDQVQKYISEKVVITALVKTEKYVPLCL